MPTFAYNTGVPAANDNPSIDQPDMLGNCQNINSIIAIDHVSFNSANGGTHKQITFSSNNVPAIPTTFPTLFTNTQDGAGNTLPGSVPELFFYSGDNTRTTAQNTCVAVGSVVLMGGIIMKWGQLAGVVSNQLITFAGAFPNNVFSLVVGGGRTTSTPQPIINFDQASLTTSNFRTRIDGTTPINYYYIAIGN